MINTSNKEASLKGHQAKCSDNEEGPIPNIEDTILEIKHLCQEWNRDDIIARHQIGRLVTEIKGTPNYGSKSIDRLAEELDLGKSWLYEAATVAEAWSRGEMEQLVDRLDEKQGRPLKWSHFLEIAKLADPVVRKNWLERTLQEGLTVRQIRAGEPPPVDPVALTEEDGAREGATKLRRWLTSIVAQTDVVTQTCKEWRSEVHMEAKSATADDQFLSEMATNVAKLKATQEALHEITREMEELLPNHITKSVSEVRS